ncbi:YdeI/OmpD-associated family protein [Albidovulum sp.]|uniref:YdeI/OmpD-associated family protein n=1 Tax=Albidovulum sp. TaxID=1872424 RepID=UPI0039B8CF6D
MITEIEDYFTRGCGRCDRFATPDCSTRRWARGLADLRRICRGAGLVETVKWGHPCYMHAGRNIALIGAFRDDFRLSFFNAALMTDPDGVLERQGPNTRHPGMMRFADNGRVAAMAPVIAAYLAEAMGYAGAGLRPPKEPDDPDLPGDLPGELAEALDADPELAEAFHRLTPGRRKSYVINLNGAVKPETRVARIERFRDRILAGKGAMER